jgi:hypothetical protein
MINKMNKFLASTLFLLVSPFFIFAQEEAVLLAIPSKECKILLDGVEIGQGKAGSALRIVSTSGEHYLEAQTNDGLTKGELVQLEKGKQKIVKIELVSSTPVLVESVAVAEINFDLPGSVTTLAWASEHENESYPYPTFYYAFEKGDEIILNVTMSNKKGTNIINVLTYPDGVVRYTNNAFTELNDMHIKVPERAIYQFVFASNHAFDRNCFLKVTRKPASNFNTKVTLKKISTPKTIVEPTALRVNSGSNAFWKNGKSRILVPVALPPNTIEWFYRFSASRNQEDIDNVRKNFQLFGELTTLFLQSTGFGSVAGKAVKIGVEQLAQPPGSNHCDIYLLDYENIAGFEAKSDEWKYVLQGSRQNLMSGNVKVDCCIQGQYYLGIRNPDEYDGINVSIEVIAITAREEYMMEN